MSYDKTMDLAGPGIGSYSDLDNSILPNNYKPLLAPMERMDALFAVKRYIEDNLCKELNLKMVVVPLIVETNSGVNDNLDRDGSRTAIDFKCGLGLDQPIKAQIVQAATKWKRVALKEFERKVGEGINTDMRAVRKDYFLDHDHSCYVDQWDWERVISEADRNLDFLTDVVKKIWKVIKGAETYALDNFPKLKSLKIPELPNELTFLHAEEILEMYPDMPRKERETAILQKYPGVFIYGIGWVLNDGYPHEMRAADYDDWATETKSKSGKPCHGLNGDILIWNHITKRRHELSSMGIRVNAKTMRQQLEMTNQLHFLDSPYHQGVLNNTLPLSIGGGIGQSRTYMAILRTAHLGEVSCTVWPKELKAICEKRNIFCIN